MVHTEELCFDLHMTSVTVIHKMKKKYMNSCFLLACRCHCKNILHMLYLVKTLQFLSTIRNMGCFQACEMLNYNTLVIVLVIKF